MLPVGLSFTSGELWLALAAAGLGAAVAVWAYRALGPVLRPSVRTMLLTLRTVSLVFVAFLLARPLLSLAGDGAGGRGVIVLLTDRSRSMDLPADSLAAPGAKTRAAVADDATGRAERALSSRFKVVRRSFAARVAAEDSLPGGAREASALGDALAGALEGVDTPRGVVLVSDGAQTTGRDAVRAARELGLPVGTVAIGEPPAHDVAVLDVLANPTARVGQDTPAEVRLVAFGPPRRVHLTLGDGGGGKPLVSEEVALPGGGAEVVRRLSYRPTRAGLTVFEVSAPAGDGASEWSPVNNRRAFAQEVLPDKQRVLVLAGSYHWDWTWARRAIAADSAYAPDHRVFARGAFQRIGPRGTLLDGAGVPSSAGALRSYALVALIGVEDGQLSPAAAQALAAYVSSGGGLVVVGGAARSGVLSLAGTALGKTLGIARGRAVPFLAEARPALTDLGRNSDLVRLDDDPAINAAAWDALPPLENATPLAVSASDRVDVADQSGRVALVIERRAGRGRAVFVNGASTYRWGFSGSDADAPRRYERWWGNLLRSLAEPAQTEPLRLVPERPLVARGEPVRLNAALQDASFAPVSGARITVDVRGPANRSVSLDARGEGAYEATLTGLPPGRYRASARAERGGRAVGSANATFWIDAQSAEWQDVAPDPGLLAAVARASGGTSVRAGKERELVKALTEARPRAGRERTVRLWESPLAFALIGALLSSEWWRRRKRGLA